MTYLVFHDAYDNGAMEIWESRISIEALEAEAELKNAYLSVTGADECGFWKAYSEIPHHIDIWSYHKLKEKQCESKN